MSTTSSPPLPANWTCHQHIDSDGLSYQYYHNEITKQTSWELPEPNYFLEEDFYIGDIDGNEVDDQNKGGTLCGDDCPYIMPKFDIPEDRLREEKVLRHHEDEDDSPRVFHQDYLNMARQYKTQRLYSDIKIAAQICVLCNKRNATHVLFPCEHRCLCNVCIDKEEICADNKMVEKTHGYCNCPLCAGVIKKILPFDEGKEVEEYWKWVYEFQPVFTDKFHKRWKHSASVIDKVYVQRADDETKGENRRRTSSRSCALM